MSMDDYLKIYIEFKILSLCFYRAVIPLYRRTLKNPKIFEFKPPIIYTYSLVNLNGAFSNYKFFGDFPKMNSKSI